MVELIVIGIVFGLIVIGRATGFLSAPNGEGFGGGFDDEDQTNPATGLSMSAGVDIGGNVYGSDGDD